MSYRNDSLRGGNALKLGLFGANCSSGRSYIVAPERWDTTWEHNLRLAQLADDAGLECLVPIARWKGYGGQLNPNGTSWESITWACGLLAATRQINVFATVHVPLNHPLVAAKQMATADHIGRGRFGVNVVCGWNDDEFQMFGVTKQTHDDRYEQGAEWWEIVTRIWSGEPAFDFDGRHYRLAGVEGSPLPFGPARPIMMNAGVSPAGRDFALRYSDMHFVGLRSLEEGALRIAETKTLARAAGRDVQVWAPVGVVCRPTQQEAVEFTRYVVAHADDGSIGHLADMHRRDAVDRTDPEGILRRTEGGLTERQVLARGAYCLIGDPDHVSEQLLALQRIGLDGVVLNFVNYLDEFPYFVQEVLPRLAAAGSRSSVTMPATDRAG